MKRIIKERIPKSDLILAVEKTYDDSRFLISRGLNADCDFTKELSLNKSDCAMDIIKDSTCTELTPIIHGHKAAPIFGLGQPIVPRQLGKQTTAYEQKMLLPALLPLEDYDLIIVLFSGGKDSAAAYFRLREFGVPKDKIELWHHDIDGGHPDRRMDWPVTLSYVRAFAKAEGVWLRVSWRRQGFFGELSRFGASQPIVYENDNGLITCRMSEKQLDSERLRGLHKLTDAQTETLKSYGTRLKFPAKTGDLSRRWCSAYLKIDVASAVIRNLEHTKSDARILLISGERRGESPGRSRYNEMELHTTHAAAKAHWIVHHWRAVIDYTLRDVWEVCRRHRLTPHPCYTCGWNRCSCMTCIFSLPGHWAGIRELFPKVYNELCQDERRLGFTLDNKKTLPEYAGGAASCVCRDNPVALRQLITGQFSHTEIYTDDWRFPSGAFKGSAGGPC
jgi:3'-phosphoadenosine 5'-phosphosulfate sulfotransferase (PAPS reductase)/FAD synthetase